MSTGTPEVLTGGTHTITNALTHVTTNNSAVSVEDQASYTAVLTADEDYTIQSVTITMGGADISDCYADGTITIPAVTGDVVITAAAEAIVYGVYPASYPGTTSPATPVLYKIGYCKNGSVVNVQYSNNLTSADGYSKAWVADLSKYSGYQACDGIQIMVNTHKGAAITQVDVLTTEQLQVTASTTV